MPSALTPHTGGATPDPAISIGPVGSDADSGWQLVTELHVDDETEAVWLSSSGLVATVRQVRNDQWRLRVRVVNEGSSEVAIQGLRLTCEAPGRPVRRWGGGARALIFVDGGHDCLLVRQVSGFSIDDDAPGLPLFSRRCLTPGAAVTCEWAVERVESPAAVLQHLPAWWPDRLVRRPGEPILLGDGTELPAPDDLAPQVVTIPEERGETLLTVHTLPAMDSVVAAALPGATRAARVVLSQAASALGLPDDTDRGAAVEDLLSRGVPSPLAVIAAAREVLATGSSDLVETLADALDRLGDQPGSELARVHATVALFTVTGAAPDGHPHPDALPDPAWLGAGLPGRTDADPLDVAMTIAACGLVDHPNRGLAVPVDEVVRQATAQLLATDVPPEVVAWLVLGAAW